ncbi:MAG: hypothetical protein ACXW3Z_09300 [Limisphaerales bacterium]
MNVLEIYPNFSWWFEGRSVEEIQSLRAISQATSDDAQTAAFERVAPALAFHLLGDAATFDLIPGAFDEIIVHYSPSALKRLVLESRIKSWLTGTGTYRFQPDFNTDENHSDANNEGLRPVWMIR